MARRTAFVSVNLTSAARDDLRQATIDLTSAAGTRLSMSELLVVALRVARAHPEELVHALTATVAQE